MGLLREFREFAIRGNVIDLAVGIIIGAAFNGIVKSLVDDVVMPPIAAVMGNVDFSDRAWTLDDTGPDDKPVELRYGKFLQAVLNFLIVAFAVFLLVKVINEARRRMERKAEQDPKAPEVPADVRLLTEIRDELRRRPA